MLEFDATDSFSPGMQLLSAALAELWGNFGHLVVCLSSFVAFFTYVFAQYLHINKDFPVTLLGVKWRAWHFLLHKMAKNVDCKLN